MLAVVTCFCCWQILGWIFYSSQTQLRETGIFLRKNYQNPTFAISRFVNLHSFQLLFIEARP